MTANLAKTLENLAANLDTLAATLRRLAQEAEPPAKNRSGLPPPPPIGVDNPKMCIFWHKPDPGPKPE